MEQGYDAGIQLKGNKGFLIQRLIAWGMLLVGIMMLAWPTGEALYGSWSQYQLRAAFRAESRRMPSMRQAKYPLSVPIAHKITGETTRKLGPAQSLTQVPRKSTLQKIAAKRQLTPARWQATQIMIPSIELDALVVSGISKAALRRGPGHDPATALPGQAGNCVIAAHRNAYGWWFKRLDEIQDGDFIYLETPQNTYIYQVAFSRTVDAGERAILAPPPSTLATPRLTLYTCTLPKSQFRLVVVANLVSPK